MSRMKSLPLLLALTIAVAAFGTLAWAEVRATIVLKNGQRISGTNLWYRVDHRNVMVRSSQSEEPRFPADQVAFIDFGGSPDPRDLNLSGSQEAVVLRDGGVLRGQIIEAGHMDRGNQNSPYLVIIRTENGDERRLNVDQVARIYFSGSGASSGGGAATPPATLDPDVSLSVSAQQQWTPTNFTVRRGETLMVRASGEINIGGNNPRATPDGASETNQNNPLRTAQTGALIGRIGNSQPFLVGSDRRFQAPAAGQLFLGINDSYLQDNQGAFEVRVERISRQ